MSRLLWPELAPDDVTGGWLPDALPMKSSDVLSALSRRHPMDGFNGMPGRWVFVREVQASTGAYSGVQRFDAVAIGLTPAVKYARVVYEVKVSRADWLRELRPMVQLQDRFGVQLIGGKRAAAIIAERERFNDRYAVADARKWDAALAVSTEFYVAAPAQCVQLDELPPEAGFVEVRPWGKDREFRARVVRPAPVRQTPIPDAGFWAAVLRRVAER